MNEHRKPKPASEHEADRPTGHKPASKKRSLATWLIVAVLGILVILLVLSGYVYAASPTAIRKPQMEHLHFRMQVLVNGDPVDFGEESFQTPYAKDQCSGELSKEPIHFHDGKDQFVHIHWKKMTGGQVLKNYGWNLIGGSESLLGYRLDELPKIKKVPVHGRALPELPKDAKFWVYTGDEKDYKERTIEDFKHQTLERFFEKQSNFLTYQPGGNRLLAWFFPAASAHAGHDHAETPQQPTSVETPEERLTRINNLIGNVVVFAQADKPSADQIKARFSNLEPLSDSTCGG